jgi:hypothetical protein
MNYFNFSSRIPKTVTKFFVTTLLVVSLFFSDASLANAGPLDDLAAQIGQGLVDQLVGTVGSTLATNLVNITGVSQAANLIGAQSINAIGDIIISGGVDGLANAAVSAGGQAINTVLSDIGAVNGVMLFQNVQSDIMSNIGSIFTSGADPASFANGIINTGVQEFSNFVNDLGLTQATNFLGTIA